ncbi:MAG TPA: hypothetical protein VLH56_16855 [Dissulfurispiraceae bacterium]|nr:hypothetical protein [Dissulfurispiraceae bacterium]
MSAKYHIRLIEPGTRITVWYRYGQLHKWQLDAGKLQANWYEQLYRVIPFHEAQIEQYKGRHSASVEYSPAGEKPRDDYRAFVDMWFAFYRGLTGVDPKYGGSEGKALKEIADYLEKVSVQRAEALALWQHILGNWRRLDAFTRGKPQLTYINSHLNSIIIQLKHGQTGSNKATSDADDLRRGL